MGGDEGVGQVWDDDALPRGQTQLALAVVGREVSEETFVGLCQSVTAEFTGPDSAAA